MALAIFALVSPASADAVGGNTRDCSHPISYTEANFTVQKMHFTVDITDHNGDLIQNLDLGDIPGHGSVTIPIDPTKLPRTDTNCDATNHSWLVNANGGMGARADLSLETVVFDPVTKTYSIESNAGNLLDNPQFAGGFLVPDLWADTNGDGMLDTGDDLYSLIDFAQVTGPYIFVPLQTVNVVNGVVASLPGMRFSTTPLFSIPPRASVTAPPTPAPPRS